VEAAKADSRPWPAWCLAALLALGLFSAALEGGAYAAIVRGEAFVMLWWTLVLALGCALLPRARGSRIMTISLVGWIGLAGWIALSLLWTESRERTFIELARVLGFAGVVLAVAVSFRGDEWRLAVAAVTAAAVGVCALAMTSRLAPELFDNPLSSAGLLRRLAFPLNYWNALGCWSAMTVALSLAWSAHARPWPVRGAALAGVCLAATVVYLTYSRSATAAVLIGTLAVVGLSRHRWLAAAHALVALAGTGIIVLAVRAAPEISRGAGGEGGGTVAMIAGLVFLACPLAALVTRRAGLETRRMPPRNARVALIVAGVFALLAAGAVGPALASRAWESFHRPTPSLTGDPVQRFATLGGTRSALWSAALRSFADHPLGGTGAGTYEFVWNRDPHRAYRVRDAHSLYVESLGELGLPGALLVLVVLGSLLAAAVRVALSESDAGGAGAGAAAALLVFCVCAGVDWMWESTVVTAMAVALGGLAAAAGARPSGPLGARRRVGATIVAVLALGVQLPVLAAAVQVRVSQRATRAGDVDEAVSAATTAVLVAPWGAAGYAQRAVVLERLGLGARAAADARRATDREPTNWEHWLVLARIEAERGRIGPAVAAARRAAALNPRAPLFAAPKRPTNPRRP
jgi:O-Antigen ligase